jgi:hypothetical protein
MFNGYMIKALRLRAERAEAERDAALEAVRIANEQLAGVQLRMEQRAALVSIVRDKRKARMIFVRNGVLTEVTAYVSMDTDWDEIERRLIRNG